MNIIYEINRIKNKVGFRKYEYIYRVNKTNINHGISSRKIFEGTLKECKQYCIENNIKTK